MNLLRSCLVTGLAAATLMGCGGSSDAPSSPVDGSYTSSCELFDVGIYANTALTISANLSKVSLSNRFFTNNACTGTPAATVTAPDWSLSSAGTKSVAGPTAGSTLTAYKITISEGTGAYSFSGTVRASTTPGYTEVKIGTTYYPFSSEVVDPAVNTKEILVLTGGLLYSSSESSDVDSSGYPNVVDYTTHLTKQ